MREREHSPQSPSWTPYAVGLRFPEGPVWLPDGSLLFVELEGARLGRVRPDGVVHTVAQIGGGPNGAAIGPDGDCYICNNGGFEWHTDPGGVRRGKQRLPDAAGRIERVNLRTGQCTVLYTHTDKAPLSAPNDLVFDGTGGFWFTDLGAVNERDTVRGRVCYARADGSFVREVVAPMWTPNGIGLSPDGKTLYVAETVTARLWAFDVTAPGELALKPWPAHSPGRLVWAANHFCGFDSLAVEANGNICLATLTTGGITVVSPEGEWVEFVPIPDFLTTNICFGGPEFTTAYVTIAASGQIVSIPWKRPGLPLLHCNAPALG